MLQLRLIDRKTLAAEVSIIEINPALDLLAIVFKNGVLTCNRVLSLQKVWQKQSNGQITSVAWRPDGRILAVGSYNSKTKKNVCTLHDVENGDEINSIVKDRGITSVAWWSQDEPLKAVRDEFCTLNVVNKVNLITKDRTASTKIKENFSHQLAHDQTLLNILAISTQEKRVSFYALGLFYLGDVVVLLDEPNLSSIFRSDTFQQRSNEILRVSKMYAKITDELEYLSDTMTAITTSWADVLAGLDSKLSSYCSRNNRKSNESYTFLSADELLQLLVIGFPSDNLEKFLADMSDKGLKKLNNAIEQTCLRVQNLIVKNALKCCHHLHGDLNLLKGMSLWHERFAAIGLDEESIVKSMRAVGSLLLKLTELQQVIDHSLKSTKSFFRWLISIACRMSGEPTNSVSPNDINKMTQQDIQLITDFILENFDYNSNQDDLDMPDPACSDESAYSNRPTCSNFTLEQVGQYLKSEPLSRQKYSFTKPGSNFWIDFCKQRPELVDPKTSSVLLFYKHNADTSLVQEHKNTCRSIEAAFKSVSKNIKLVLKNNDDFINVKQILKNAPVNRIYVETDIKMMQNFTLFQTKPIPSARQYLLAQSTEDRSFRLISIEFVASSDTSARSSRSASSLGCPIQICDTSFYHNKDGKKMFVTFLLSDQSMGDTLIVQVDIKKLLDNSGNVYRVAKEATKIFRSSDTIEKYSSPIVLKLDIYTEPASERKNEADIMVKKIKSTIGRDIFSSSDRQVIAFVSSNDKRLHLYEVETSSGEPDVMDDEVEGDEKIDESLIDTV